MLKRISDYVVVDVQEEDNNRLASDNGIFIDLYKCQELAAVQYGIRLKSDPMLDITFVVNFAQHPLTQTGELVTIVHHKNFIEECNKFMYQLDMADFSSKVISKMNKYIATINYLVERVIGCKLKC